MTVSIDVLPWFVTTELPEISLSFDRRGRTNAADAAAVRSAVLRHVAAATGVSVPAAVHALKLRGYDEVAVMIRLPTTKILREFATPGEADGLDTAFVQLQRMGTEPGAYAHELLHLFGADDIYRLAATDPRDEGDIMGGGCSGWGGVTKITDATAWAIGWRDRAPARAYSIGDNRAEASPHARAGVPGRDVR